MRIMVTGAGGSAGYNVTKCLKDKGHFVLGVDTDEMMIHLSPADATSVVRDRRMWHDKVDSYDIDYILPQPEADVQYLAGRTDLPHWLPSKKIVDLCADKLKLADYLADLAPPSFAFPNTTQEVDDLLSRHRQLWLRARVGAGAHAALGPVDSLGMIYGWLDYWCKDDKLRREDFMFSEYLPFNEYTWQGVYRAGVLLGEFARKRVTRMIKQGFSGTPSIAESTMDNDVLSMGRDVVKRLKWKNGVIGVDMKANSMDELKVTEVNTRFYTTTLFPAALGVNLPHQLVTGEGWLLGYEWPRWWVRQPDAGYKLV